MASTFKCERIIDGRTREVSYRKASSKQELVDHFSFFDLDDGEFWEVSECDENVETNGK